MEAIKSHIKSEQDRKSPDSNLIERLNKVLSKGGLSFEEFCASGTFIPSEIFKWDNPDIELDKDCTDVIRYYGNFIVQGLKSGLFIADINGSYIESKSLSVIEDTMWSIHINKVMNK